MGTRNRCAQAGFRKIAGGGIAVPAFVDHRNHHAAVAHRLRRFGDVLPHAQLFAGFLDKSHRAKIDGGDQAFEGGFERRCHENNSKNVWRILAVRRRIAMAGTKAVQHTHGLRLEQKKQALVRCSSPLWLKTRAGYCVCEVVTSRPPCDCVNRAISTSVIRARCHSGMIAAPSDL